MRYKHNNWGAQNNYLQYMSVYHIMTQIFVVVVSKTHPAIWLMMSGKPMSAHKLKTHKNSHYFRVGPLIESVEYYEWAPVTMQ